MKSGEKTGKPAGSVKTSRRWLFSAVFFFFAFFILGAFALLVKLPPGIIARGAGLGPWEVGGLTQAQAEQLVKNQTDSLEKEGLLFYFRNQEIRLPSVIYSPVNPELSKVVFDFDASRSVQSVYQLGREGNKLEQFAVRFWLRLSGQRRPLVFSFDEKIAKDFLKENISFWESPGRDAGFKIAFDSVGQFSSIQTVKEEKGFIFDYDSIVKESRSRLEKFDLSPLLLALVEVSPSVGEADASGMKDEAEAVLKRGDISLFLQGEKKKFFAVTAVWGHWLKMVKKDGRAGLGLDEEAVSRYLKDEIGKEVEVEIKEPKFRMESGRVSEFQAGVSGLTIDEKATLAELEKIIFGEGERAGEIKIKTAEPRAVVGELNDLGIREIIGVGRSNFAGSPPNRIHNIKTGAASLNGILIAPGEIFSLIRALGKVDAERGYKTELVIKGNKTIPEFGGGLCQIGTTVFRAALASGLPIVERQNHSYRVGYYEPPIGLDATIYAPKPDFKFLNDTGKYILIQTKIEGADVIFEFWGNKDGRQIIRTEPVVSNRVPPPPPKLIETLDLPPGKKKCTEKPRAGADAVFTYTVTYPDGAVKNQEFKSRYRPWGEVCLVGVEKLSEPAPVNGEESASSTEQKTTP